MKYNYAVLVESVKLSTSPKLAYNMAKDLLGYDPQQRANLSRECLDSAWADASRFNRMIERLEGKLQRPARKTFNESLAQGEIERVLSSRKPIKEFGRILAEYDACTVQYVYETVGQHLESKVTDHVHTRNDSKTQG